MGCSSEHALAPSLLPRATSPIRNSKEPNYNGFVLRGSGDQSILLQFHANAPVLVVGDTSASPTAIHGVDIRSMRVDYCIAER
jgi:hypothetical protein